METKILKEDDENRKKLNWITSRQSFYYFFSVLKISLFPPVPILFKKNSMCVVFGFEHHHRCSFNCVRLEFAFDFCVPIFQIRLRFGPNFSSLLISLWMLVCLRGQRRKKNSGSNCYSSTGWEAFEILILDYLWWMSFFFFVFLSLFFVKTNQSIDWQHNIR